MNWKTTLVLLVLVGAMGAYVYWGESSPLPKPTQNVRPIPDFKVDDVTKVVVQRGKGLLEEIVLVKDGTAWRMEKPVADKADDGKVKELISPIEFMDATAVKEGEEAKKVTFGDVEQRLTVSRPQDKGGDFTLEIGQSNVGETRNLRVVGRDAVYLVKKDLPEHLGWETFLFRAKEVFSIPSSDVGKISAKLPSLAPGPNASPRLVELVKGKDHFWHVGGSDGELAENRKVEEVLNKLKDLKAMGVVSDAPTDAQLKEDEVTPPDYEVTLVESGDKSTKTDTVAFGKKVDAAKNEERFTKSADKATLYRVDATDLLKLLDRDPTVYRSDSLFPLGGTVDSVTGLAVKWKDGKAWSLKKAETDWEFETPSKGKADNDVVKSLVKNATDLKIVTREEVTDFGKYGLSDPAYVITLKEGDVTRTLSVGNTVESGIYYVRRGDESRVFTTKLGTLESTLQAASLTARAKTIFKAAHWDMNAWKLAASDGKVESSATKEGNDWLVHVPEYKKEDVDSAKVTKVFEPFDDLKADVLVAEVSSASVTEYGLDAPKTLTITVESWDATSDKRKKEDKVLLIGRRDGDSVYAMEKDGAVIGKVKAEFLDLIDRGFRKGKDFWNFAAYDCISFTVKDPDGKEILKIEKKKVPPATVDEWYLGSQKLVTSEVQEKLVRPFEKLEGFQVEEATDKSKEERGLKKPFRTIVTQTKSAWGDHKDEVVTKTLLIGRSAGPHDIYAMDEAGTESATIFDGPVTKIDAFIQAPPLDKTAPPPLIEKKDGVGAVGTPSTPGK